jgi:RND family efflux transporter MFP subunit
MKNLLASIGIVSALAAWGCGGGQPEASAPAPERKLSTARVERADGARPIEIDGVVVGRVEAVLASRLAAQIVEVSAVPGRTVKSGTVLVRLEEREADGAVEGARASVEAARSALELARKNRSRFEKLEGRGAAAAIELDRARQAEASAAAGLASAEAALSRAVTDRAQTVLAAPFDAVVVEKMVSVGDLAGPGRPLVRVASIAGRRVEAAPSEEEAARLSPGDEVEVVIGGRSLRGRVVEIVGAVDPATRRRTIRIDLPEGTEPAVGTFARVLLPGPREPRILAPARAVVARGGLKLAWAVGSDGKAALRYVRTGPVSGDLVEIRSGLDAGETVVLDPPADLEAGTRVRS